MKIERMNTREVSLDRTSLPKAVLVILSDQFEIIDYTGQPLPRGSH